jgi:hypothetical protein
VHSGFPRKSLGGPMTAKRLLLGIAFLLTGLVVPITMDTVARDGTAYAATSLETDAVTWAIRQIGSKAYGNLCLQFAQEAYQKGANLPIQSLTRYGSFSSSTYPQEVWADGFRKGITGGSDTTPPYGALVFYNASGPGAGDPSDYSHVTIMGSDGEMISTPDVVDENAVHYETMGQVAAAHPYNTYVGWWLPDGTASSVPPTTTVQGARAGSTWLNYLDTKVGQSCTISGTTSQGVVGTDTLELSSMYRTSAGTVLNYRSEVTAIATGVPAVHTTTNLPYVVLRNGDLGAEPDLGSLGNGFQWSYQGFELYPPISSLRLSSASLVSFVTMSLSATTSSAKQQLEQILTSGSEMHVRLSVKVFLMAPQHNIVTPAGLYSDYVGVKFDVVSMQALNVKSQYAASFSSASSLATSMSGTTTYFARGTGPVRADEAGLTLLRSGCAE